MSTFGLGGGFKTKQFVNYAIPAGVFTMYTCPADTLTFISLLNDPGIVGNLQITSPGGISVTVWSGGVFSVPENRRVIGLNIQAGFLLFPGENLNGNNSSGGGFFFRYGLLEQ